MIKNMVFDMGNVLVAYDANKVCEHFIENPEDRREVCRAVFQSQEWILLDMGVISEEAAIARIRSRLDTDKQREMADICFRRWHEFNMWPVEGMGELVRSLKESGYCLYICSNASLRLRECCGIIPGFKYFDGVLFSAEVKCIKPQREIYLRLFEQFGINPEESFFIDDMQLNVDGAKACGMDGYCFEDMNVDRLRRILKSL